MSYCSHLTVADLLALAAYSIVDMHPQEVASAAAVSEMQGSNYGEEGLRT